MQRILIIKPSSLGDVATTLPVLCDLRRALPQAQIDWLVHPAFAALLEGHDALHDIIPFDRQRLAAWWYKPAALSAFRALLRRLRQGRYDCVIDAQGLLRSGFFTWETGAARRIGFAHAREGAALFYTDKVALPARGAKMVAVDRMRALLTPLQIDITAPAEFRLPIQPAAAQRAATLLPAGGRYAAVIPGARWATKRWALAGFTEIARRLATLQLRPVLLGAPDEQPLCAQLAYQVPTVLNLAGETSMAEMIAVLARMELVIANDSGPLHVAVALGRRCVAIYGPTDPAFVGPYGQLAHVVRHDVACFPCRKRTCWHHSCMAGVGVEEVWTKVQELAKNTAGPIGPEGKCSASA